MIYLCHLHGRVDGAACCEAARRHPPVLGELDQAAEDKGYRWSVCRSHAALAGKASAIYVVTLLRERGRVIPFVSDSGLDSVIGKALEFLRDPKSN